LQGLLLYSKKNLRSKLENNGSLSIFLGYTDNSTAYKILDISNNKIKISRNVEFFEFTPGNSSLFHCYNDITNFTPNYKIRRNNYENNYYNDNTYNNNTNDNISYNYNNIYLIKIPNINIRNKRSIHHKIKNKNEIINNNIGNENININKDKNRNNNTNNTDTTNNSNNNNNNNNGNNNNNSINNSNNNSSTNNNNNIKKQ